MHPSTPSSSPSPRSGTMSESPSYESKIADSYLKRFISHNQPLHVQATDRDNHEPCSTDNVFVSSDQTQNAQPSITNALKDLKVDQKGTIWGSNGLILGRVLDDSQGHPEELEDYPLKGKAEALDEHGQKVGQAISHHTSASTSFKCAREHIFYRLRPDENGLYYCPFNTLEDCWYRPQKLKSKFDEHLDTHLKPYRCNLGKCVDAPFSTSGYLLRHESEAHVMHGHRAKPPLVHRDNRLDSSEAATTAFSSKSPPQQDSTTSRTHDPSKDPHVRVFPDPDHFLRRELSGEDVSKSVDGVHVAPPPAATYGRTLSSGLNEKLGRVTFEPPLETKWNVPSKHQYHPKFAPVPTFIDPQQSKEKKKVEVDVDFLNQLSSKMSSLETRIEECVGRPGSPTNSSISDSQESIESVSDDDNGSIREARHSRHVHDDDILIFEPEVIRERRDAAFLEGPNLTITRYKSFGDMPRIEVFDEGLHTDTLRNRPLLALTEEYCSNGKLWRRRLEVASPSFYELLKEVSCHNLNDIALQDNVLHLTEPFMVLFLNRKQLADYVENTKEFTPVKEQAKFILNFLERDFSDISRMLDNFESVTPPNLVKYCDLWMLYRPGTMVYSRANGEWEAFVVDSLDGMQVRQPSSDNSHALTRLDVRAWSMNFDGEVYGRVWSFHCIAPFHGVKDISFLPLVPEKFLPDAKLIKEMLLSRGKKFCHLQVQHCQTIEASPSQATRVMVDHLTYQRRNGWLISIDGKYEPSSVKNSSWTETRYSDWDTTADIFDRRPRRYTPQRSLIRHFENEYCNRDYVLESIDAPEDTQAQPCRSYSTDRPPQVVVRKFEKYDLIQPDTEIDELSLMLCPQHVRGYCLRDKVWKFFNVSQLQPVFSQSSAWDRLALDEEYKDLLETMLWSHTDRVSGLRGSAAGKGLSILLHGEAGVGKTLTAETIADHFGRPLFPVTCSDIGISVPKFDERLEEISDYATKWGAVLLFDEADLLLQARRDYECANLRRNELVSSFVRFLEYYQGIVFITTNRVSRFDGAIMPRIDLTLGLPALDRGRRVSVWHNQIQALFDEGTINASRFSDLCALALEKWGMEDLNGHQIKKTVRTARVVAEKKGRMLGRGEIEMMLRMEREFLERAGCLDRETEREGEKKKVGGKKDGGDLEGFEQVEKP